MSKISEKELLSIAKRYQKRDIYSVKTDDLFKYKDIIIEYIVNSINEAHYITDGKYDEIRKLPNYKPPERLLQIENNLKILDSFSKFILDESERRENICNYSTIDFYNISHNIFESKRYKELYELAYNKLNNEQKHLLNDSIQNIRDDELGYKYKIEKIDLLFGPDIVTAAEDQIMELDVFKNEIQDILPYELKNKIPEKPILSDYYISINNYLINKANFIIENGLDEKSREYIELKELFEKLTNNNSRLSQYYQSTKSIHTKNINDPEVDKIIHDVNIFCSRISNLSKSYQIDGIEYDRKLNEKIIQERLRFNKLADKFDYGYAENDRKKRRNRNRTFNKLKRNIKKIPYKVKHFIRIKILDIFKMEEYSSFGSKQESLGDKIKIAFNKIKNITSKNKKEQDVDLSKKANLVKEKNLNMPEEKNISTSSDLQELRELIHANHSRTDVNLLNKTVKLSDEKNHILIFDYETKKILKNTFDIPNDNLKKIINSITTGQILKECENKQSRRNQEKAVYNFAKNIDLKNPDKIKEIEEIIKKCLGTNSCSLDIKTGDVVAHSIKNNEVTIIKFNINNNNPPILESFGENKRQKYKIENNIIKALRNGLKENNIQRNRGEDLDTKIFNLGNKQDQDIDISVERDVAESR